MIKSHLAGGATVTESAFLLDVATGDEREVDVVIASQIAGHSHMVKIECRDHKRPQSVCWVDEMYGKHRDLPRGVLALASSSGFTPKARVLAAKRGIELIELDTSPESARRIAERSKGLIIRTRTLEPGLAVATVKRTADGPSESVEFDREHRFYLPDGRVAVTGHDIVQGLLQEAMDLDVMSNATVGMDPSTIVLDPAEFRFGSVDGPVSFYMCKMSDPPELWKVVKIMIGITLKIDDLEVPFSHGQIGSTEFSHGEVEVLEDKLFFVATSDGGVENLSVRNRAGEVMRIN